MRIAILAFNGCLPSGIVGLVDMFALTEKALHMHLPQALPACYHIQVVSHDGAPIHDGRGRLLNVDGAWHTLPQLDAILIPGFWQNADELTAHAADFAAITPWLIQQHKGGAWLGASCAGSFVLGEAGLLNGTRCTTTWWLHDELKRRFPKADAAWGAALIEDKRIVTAGGPMSWISIALHIIRAQLGSAAARIASDFAVLDNTPSHQAVYVPSRFTASQDGFLLAAEQLVRQARTEALRAPQLAQALHVSERTLHRRLKHLTGEAPKTFMARIRLETARTLLETSDTPIQQIALHTGYADVSNFRRAFRIFSGMSPSGYRTWSQARRHTG